MDTCNIAWFSARLNAVVLTAVFAAVASYLTDASEIFGDQFETEHFIITYSGTVMGSSNAPYARAAGGFLEEAYRRYHSEFGFQRIGQTNCLLGRQGKWEVTLLVGVDPVRGLTGSLPIVQGNGSTYGLIRYGLNTNRYGQLHQTCFHEYFHAVTNRYLPYATEFTVLPIMNIHAKAEAWCIEGSARFMQYWAIDFPNGAPGIGIEDTDDDWLHETNQSLRSFGDGYPAFLFWHFLVANRRIDFDGDGKLDGRNAAVIRRFWEAMGRFTNWGWNHEQQTTDAMDVALVHAPQDFASFDKAFAEFTRSLLFARDYYGADLADMVAMWLPKWRKYIVQTVDLGTGDRSLTGDDAVIEPMGARWFEVQGVPKGKRLEIQATWDDQSGYVAAIYPGGALNAVSTLTAGETRIVAEGTVNGTLLVLTRLPTATGSDDCRIDFRLQDSPKDEGMLDVVVLIDKSGSMSDDIECVQREVDTMLGEIATLAQQENISLHVGLVMFSYTGANVFEECMLSEDIESARQFVKNLNPLEVGGDEDLYSALMYAMNEPVEGKQIDMGWRTGAAKITIPITDEAPTSNNFNVFQIAKVAEDLDPVHMYPLIMPKSSLLWLEPTERSLKELARVTNGQAVRVQDAKALPAAIVTAVKIAIRRHKEEIWRKENPPYGLYAVVAALAGLAVFSLAGVVVGQLWQRHRAAGRPDTAGEPPLNPTLTGDAPRGPGKF